MNKKKLVGGVLSLSFVGLGAYLVWSNDVLYRPPAVGPELAPLAAESENEWKKCAAWLAEANLGAGFLVDSDRWESKDAALAVLKKLETYPGPNRAGQKIYSRVAADRAAGKPADIVALFSAHDCVEIQVAMALGRLAVAVKTTPIDGAPVAAAALKFLRAEAEAPGELVNFRLQIDLFEKMLGAGLVTLPEGTPAEWQRVKDLTKALVDSVKARNADAPESSPDSDRPNRREVAAILQTLEKNLAGSEPIRAAWRNVLEKVR